MRTLDEISDSCGLDLSDREERNLFDLKCKSALGYFANHVMPWGPLMNPVHQEWCRLLQDPSIPRLCLEAARDHLKSNTTTVAYSIWNCRYVPNDYGYLFSYSQEQGNDYLERIVNVIRDNEFLMDMEPDTRAEKENWKASKVTFLNRSTIVSRGFGTSSRGPHPRWIVCDDIYGDKLQYSLEYVSNFFKGTITGMLSIKGKLVLVGFPLMRGDLFEELKKNPEWLVKSYPAELDAEKQIALWPEYWTWDLLKRREKEVGHLMYMREYMLKPLEDAAESMFPWTFLKAPGICNESKHLLDKGFDGKRYLIACDPAFSWKGDYAAFIVAEPPGPSHPKLEIVWAERHKGLSGDDIIGKLKFLAQKFPPHLVIVEANAFKSHGKNLDEINLPVVQPTMTREAKVQMLLSQLWSRFNSQSIEFPYAPGPAQATTELILAELNSLGFAKGKLQGIGSHDDYAITLGWLNEASYLTESVGTDSFALR